jgi:hypothetical protein
MFGKPGQSGRKSYKEAVISREVDTFPEEIGWSPQMSQGSIGPNQWRTRSSATGSLGSVPRTTMPAERAIKWTRAEHQWNLKRKIKNLCQLAQKQLDNVIEDLLPKYRLVLHPSHPHFT